MKTRAVVHFAGYFWLIMVGFMQPVWQAAAWAEAGSAEEGNNGVIRQVRTDGDWHEAEAFVVLPGQKAQLRAVCAELAGEIDLAELMPAEQGATTRTYSVSTSTQYEWTVRFGRARRLDGEQLEWVAPLGPGHFKVVCRIEKRWILTFKSAGSDEKRRELPALSVSTTFHMLVPHEFDPNGRGVIEGYPIGIYPRETAANVKPIIAAHRERYRPPRWFVAVTPETRDLRISQHFRLREFVPDAPGDSTVYFPYNANLVRALEAIRQEIERTGVKQPRIRILRGFVSPYDAEHLRRRGARLITWNRYQYGDAVLIIVDGDLDGLMDDLNGDGKADIEDCRLLARIVSNVQSRLRMPGWIGIYGRRADKTLPETPMVGFDLRGWRVGTTEAPLTSP